MASARMSKSKGYRGEVEVISILMTVISEEYQRAGIGAPPELSRSPNGRDIRGIPWIALEVKRREPLRDANGQHKEDHSPSQIAQWWEQTKANTLLGQESVLIYRKNHSPWQVRMFGKLHTERAAIRLPVDISLEGFLTWFRVNLREKLAPSQTPASPAA